MTSRASNARRPDRAPRPKSEPPAKRYPFVAVDVRPEAVDQLSALFFAQGALGVEERDEGTLKKGPGDGRVTIVGAFADVDVAKKAIRAIKRRKPTLVPRLEEVIGDGWRDAWKEHFAPFALTDRVWIVPPWIQAIPSEASRAHVLVLEPGRAFGTGLHASTQLVAGLLEGGDLKGRAVLDVGTGSGILALVALRLGAARVTGVDVDAEAIAVAIENADRNGLRDRFSAAVGSASDVDGVFDVVLANIEGKILDPIAPDVAARVAPGGTLILSGLLEPEEATMSGRYRDLGLRHVATRAAGDAAGQAWIAMELRR